MNKNFRFVVFAALIFVVLTAAGCSAAAKVGAAVTQARTYYTNGIHLETTWTADYSNFMVTYSTGLLTVLDQDKVANSCFTNVHDAVNGLLAGTFDTGKNAKGDPNGILNKDAFLSALVLNQTYPDLSQCQTAKLRVMDTVTNWRTNNLDLQRKVIDDRRTYDNFLNDDLIKRTLIEALNANGPEAFGATKDFIGFPTDQLKAQGTDRSICDYYVSAALKDPLYKASWNPALNTCSLARKAAYEVMSRLLTSQQTQNRFNCGVDTGAFDTIGADCKPQITPTSVAPTPGK